MKRTVFAIALSTLAAAAMANPAAEAKALRGECAAQNQVSFESTKAANEYRFVYHKGELRGEAQPNKLVKCTENQYAAFLDKADPVRVMAAYPTAAGRPTAKPAAEKK